MAGNLMRIVGVMPMAGAGSRLGLPFHKALAPTFMADGQMVPLFRHAYDRLSVITDVIVSVLSLEAREDPCMAAIPQPILYKTTRGEAPSSITVAAGAYPGSWLAVVLPDTIWYPENGMAVAAGALADDVDGVLVTFRGPGSALDEVMHDDRFVKRIIQKRANHPGLVEGWGAFIVKADRAVEWDDSIYLSGNLDQMTLRWVPLEGSYYDLGTPEQYRLAAMQRDWPGHV